MKKIIVVSGLPGSGKSTLAEGLSQSLQIPIFSVDPIESAIFRAGIRRSFETGLAAYIVAQTLAGEQLKLGMSVIIDAVNSVKEARDMWQELSRECDAKLIHVECVLDKEIHKERIMTRERNIYGIPEVTWEDVEKRKEEYVPWKEERLIINTAKDGEQTLEEALEYIKNSNAS
jgi:predicted kinase